MKSIGELFIEAIDRFVMTCSDQVEGELPDRLEVLLLDV